MGLKNFFPYFGAKIRDAKLYPAPEHDQIIEPFAGAAGYSLRHYKKQVLLVDLDPLIADLWDYLIKARVARIMSLPILSPGSRVDALNIDPMEKVLIGRWMFSGSALPQYVAPSVKRHASLASGSTWSPVIRQRIASQLGAIRHWKVIRGSYADIPNQQATWFIDPPYQKAGVSYRCSSRDIDFKHLGEWCRSRKGQVMVCENAGADWLPFRPFFYAKRMPINASHLGSHAIEVIWTNK
jgi:hypothetical protein